jgi:membrane protein DedA with SNARE-associated domain
VITFADIAVLPDDAFQPLMYVSLFFGTFLHEGTAIASGAILVIQQQASPILTALCLVGGIVTGDLGIYGLGALARRSAWLQRRLSIASRLKSQTWFGNNLISTIAICRVVPGILFPTVLSYGWCGVPFRRVAASTMIVTALYVPLVLMLFVQFGKQITPLVQHAPWLLVAAVLIAAAALTARYVWTRHGERMDAEPLPDTCPLPAI